MVAGFLAGSEAGAQSAAEGIARDYCARVGVTSPSGRQQVYDFVRGLDSAGLLTNLLDFAFFSADLNLASGPPLSLNNTGVVIGTMHRLRGGFDFPNKTNNNGLYFTNLPPTPGGRTVIVWGAPAYHPNISNNVNNCIFELTGPGAQGETLNPICSFYAWWTPRPYFFNGTQSQLGAGHINAYNSFFVASLASGPGGCEGLYKSDYPRAATPFTGTNPVAASPSVLRFAWRNALANTNCGWLGLIRGFAYFDRMLTTNEVCQVDLLVPRVGLVIDGDSKTVSNPWTWFWCETPETWGLYSILTNSAVGGTLVSARNVGTNITSMEHRWPANSLFRTNAQFPRVIYTVRGGHNDFLGPDLAQASYITNAFKAITNLWLLGRSNGFTAVGWTIDRTGTTWTANNSNLLMLLNGWIREHREVCDYLVDAEQWFVSEFGETPYTNQAIYYYHAYNPVHETPLGGELLGRAVAAFASPGLPEPPMRFVLSAQSTQITATGFEFEVEGVPASRNVTIEASTNLLEWEWVTNATPVAGWIRVSDPAAAHFPTRYYRAMVSDRARPESLGAWKP